MDGIVPEHFHVSTMGGDAIITPNAVELAPNGTVIPMTKCASGVT